MAIRFKFQDSAGKTLHTSAVLQDPVDKEDKTLIMMAGAAFALPSVPKEIKADVTSVSIVVPWREEPLKIDAEQYMPFHDQIVDAEKKHLQPE